MNALSTPYKIPRGLETQARTGVDCSRPLPGGLDKPVFEAMEAAGLGKLPPWRKRMLYATMQSNHGHVQACRESGDVLQVFDHDRKLVPLRENVTTADIITMTTQIVAFVRDAYAPFLYPELVTTRPMLGPTAYIGRTQFTRDSDIGGAYDEGSALMDGYDPGFSECPTECADANLIGIDAWNELVEAECRRLGGVICMPANYYWDAQYAQGAGGGSLPNVLEDGMEIEIQRAIQGEGIASLVANAGETIDWNLTPEVDSYYETASPMEWRRELWAKVRQADRIVRQDTKGGGGITHLAGDINGVGLLEDLVQVDLDTTALGMDGGTLRASEIGNYTGRTRQLGLQVFSFAEGMPTDTLLALRRDDRDPTATWNPWIGPTRIGTLVDPVKAEVKVGAIYLGGKAVLRPNRIVEIRIGD